MSRTTRPMLIANFQPTEQRPPSRKLKQPKSVFGAKLTVSPFK